MRKMTNWQTGRLTDRETDKEQGFYRSLCAKMGDLNENKACEMEFLCNYKSFSLTRNYTDKMAEKEEWEKW